MFDTPHFKVNEWVKNPSKVNTGLVLALEAVRVKAGVPIHIHVAWDDGGHATHSYHYKGMAVDFHFDLGLTPLQQLEAILSVPELVGIGWYPEWAHHGWHVDIREGDRLYWVQKKGQYIYSRNLSEFKGML